MGADGLMLPRARDAGRGAGRARGDALPAGRDPRGRARRARRGSGRVAHADLASVDQRVLGVFQVESPKAVANAPAIAALDGVDVLFVGPADLSHGMGIPGRITEPAFLDALDTVVAACREHGKSAGILLRTADDVPDHLVRGFTFIGIGSDWGFMVAAARGGVAKARSAIGD